MGALAGEEMSEGCVLVSNREAGAAQESIVDSETGLLYRDGDISELASLLFRLVNDRPLRLAVCQKDWDRLQLIWLPRIAVERLVRLCSELYEGTPLTFYHDGPCMNVVPGYGE